MAIARWGALLQVVLFSLWPSRAGARSYRCSILAGEGRVEMVRIGDADIEILQGEAILTEYSHKYTLEGFAAMAAEAGFVVEKVWMDPDELFSVQYCVRS